MKRARFAEGPIFRMLNDPDADPLTADTRRSEAVFVIRYLIFGQSGRG